MIEFTPNACAYLVSTTIVEGKGQIWLSGSERA